ncbi:MBOAT family O-acyltransferase [Desulfobacter latus]|uniref:MBOAT family protein n=1 Tax=Desulfobacter latus TaxID=2292 RepID=A0A850SZX6_9BACT|nr:MBOAT family O-acyltransferase [Desulfobacter latus]NWH05660.1 MBOAT family protein [Desulfobacter latus]
MIAKTIPENREVDFLSKKGNRDHRQKLALTLSIFTNLAFLIYFKYSNFLIDNVDAVFHLLGSDGLFFTFKKVILPLGISFYTFQSMSYTIDVYFGKVKATRKFLDFLCYVTLFPQLVAGPIVRYRDIYEQIKYPTVTMELVEAGIGRFILGLAKKVIIANTISIAADGVFDQIPSGELCFLSAWVGVIAYTLQIYFDFSGYSDMAIGIGMMFGFRFLENFNYPYISKSIQEFWRRWHISLSTWFRDYLYIPLGGNRRGKLIRYRNLWVVFLLCGLWHGAEWTFIAWGVYHGSFLILEQIKWFKKLLKGLPEALQHCYLLMVASIGWAIFRSENMAQVFAFLKAMSGLQGLQNTSYPYQEFLGMDVLLAGLLGIIFSIPIFPSLKQHVESLEMSSGKIILDLFQYLNLVALFILCIILLSSGVHNPFLYFRF